ncbi:hypothetical protein RHMOL_Rhmol06G0039600 [Rhododendron molle]|uniref:Uncharacterized protein n=1 Tax=Rhododendron molle TaxID=49168 RepID=A0ACC0NAL5_RHOML|nr:hypothetical protein RHMOL_Rhmol06G0039600 [Rhododendron molle]
MEGKGKQRKKGWDGKERKKGWKAMEGDGYGCAPRITSSASRITLLFSSASSLTEEKRGRQYPPATHQTQAVCCSLGFGFARLPIVAGSHSFSSPFCCSLHSLFEAREELDSSDKSSKLNIPGWCCAVRCTAPCCAPSSRRIVHQLVFKMRFDLSERASDGSDLILETNYQEPFIADMRSEPSDSRSDGSDVHSTVLRTPLQYSITLQVSFYSSLNLTAHKREWPKWIRFAWLDRKKIINILSITSPDVKGITGAASTFDDLGDNDYEHENVFGEVLDGGKLSKEDELDSSVDDGDNDDASGRNLCLRNLNGRESRGYF